jgi:hypothetical protein
MVQKEMEEKKSMMYENYHHLKQSTKASSTGLIILSA